jgi:hypothetical protein
MGRRAKVALSYPSHFCGEGGAKRPVGFCVERRCTNTSLAEITPTRHIVRSAHDAPPSPRRRGRDEDRRCGYAVCNDSVRTTKFAPSLRAQSLSLLFPPIYGPRSEARSFFSLPLLWGRDERSSLWGGAKRRLGAAHINARNIPVRKQAPPVTSFALLRMCHPSREWEG